MLNREVRDLNREGVLRWRKRFRQYLDEIEERYPPRSNVNLDDLADMFSALADGGIILSKVVRDKELLPRQLMLYREMVRTVFLGTDRH
jgi:TetR/AcrR family transcriptional repressor of nem operon